MKTFFIFPLIFVAYSIFAQPRKGNVLLGGSVNFSSNVNLNQIKDVRFGVNPELGYFILNSLVVGGNLGYAYLGGSQRSKELYTSHSILMGVNTSYFIGKPKSKIKPYVGMSYNYSFNFLQDNIIPPLVKSKDIRTSWTSELGIAFFPREKLSIKTGFLYTRSNTDFRVSKENFFASALTFRIGVFTFH